MFNNGFCYESGVLPYLHKISLGLMFLFIVFGFAYFIWLVANKYTDKLSKQLRILGQIISVGIALFAFLVFFLTAFQPIHHPAKGYQQNLVRAFVMPYHPKPVSNLCESVQDNAVSPNVQKGKEKSVKAKEVHKTVVKPVANKCK